MASEYRRLLPPISISANFKQPDQYVADFGAFKSVGVYFKILKAGPGNANLFLEHNATLEADNWKPVVGVTITQNGTDAYFNSADFLRYLRVSGDANGNGSCIALVDIVGKE